MRKSILGGALILALLGLAGRSADAFALAGHTAPLVESLANKQTMYVTIAGPNEVQSWWPCTWIVYVQGGTPPYTYQWGAMGMIENYNTGDTWNGYAAGGGNMGLDVLVTDANNQSAWGTLLIDSSNSAPLCRDS
jgi:hypothetical protein